MFTADAFIIQMSWTYPRLYYMLCSRNCVYTYRMWIATTANFQNPTWRSEELGVQEIQHNKKPQAQQKKPNTQKNINMIMLAGNRQVDPRLLASMCIRMSTERWEWNKNCGCLFDEKKVNNFRRLYSSKMFFLFYLTALSFDYIFYPLESRILTISYVKCWTTYARFGS